MRAVVGRNAGVCLVDNHEFWTGADELIPPDVGLDVVEAHDRKWVRAENAVGLEQSPLKATGRRGGNRDRWDQELRRELLHPLVD